MPPKEPIVDLAKKVGARLYSVDDAEWIDEPYQPVTLTAQIYDVEEIARAALARIEELDAALRKLINFLESDGWGRIEFFRYLAKARAALGGEGQGDV